MVIFKKRETWFKVLRNVMGNTSIKIKKADIVVGIPSYNEADNISFVTKQVDLGLRKYFPDLKGAIINVDGHSTDNTKKIFLTTKTKTPKIHISTPKGVTGKGHSFHNLFKEFIDLNAETGIVVDADLKSITPEWIKYFGSSILQNKMDFATPLYSRHEYDGSITNNICYPLTYGLVGKNIRQPIGGDFAFNKKLVKYWLSKKWDKTSKQYGIDIFMSQNALLGGFKVIQVVLGSKIHKPSAPKLGPMFTQVVNTLFKTLLSNKEKWMKNINKVEDFNFCGKNKLESCQPLAVDYKSMKEISIYEFNINKDTLKKSLNGDTFWELHKMYKNKYIEIDSELWMRIVYDILYAYDTTNLGSELVEALKPLYFGRSASFIKETLDMSSEECERLIQKQAKTFFKNRHYFIEKYYKKIRGPPLTITLRSWIPKLSSFSKEEE